MADPAPPRRRRFQFNLRTLFVVVTLAAVALGFVFHKMNRTRQREAFIATHKATAVIGYNYRGQDGNDEVVVDVFLVPWATDEELETARHQGPTHNCRGREPRLVLAERDNCASGQTGFFRKQTSFVRSDFTAIPLRLSHPSGCYNAAMMTWKNLLWIAIAVVTLLVGICIVRHVLTLADDPDFERYRNFIGYGMIACGIIGIARIALVSRRCDGASEENPYRPSSEKLPQSKWLDGEPRKNNIPHWSPGWSAVHTVCGVSFLVFAPMIGNVILGQPFSAGSVFAVVLAPFIYGVSRLLANTE